MIMMWGGSLSTLPPGWLYCNGTAVSQASYPDLWNAIGINFGAHPPQGQFYLPDLRGRFVRGVDDGMKRDPDADSRLDMNDGVTTFGGLVGSVQSHALQTHVHDYQAFPTGQGTIASGQYWGYGTYQTSPPDPGAQVSTETRPINAYLYFIIKY
jgi:microcystin-dependent protein